MKLRTGLVGCQSLAREADKALLGNTVDGRKFATEDQIVRVARDAPCRLGLACECSSRQVRVPGQWRRGRNPSEVVVAANSFSLVDSCCVFRERDPTVEGPWVGLGESTHTPAVMLVSN